MGFLGGKHKTNKKPDYTGLQIQTAVGTLPIPLLWGRQKMSTNVIWYNGFTAYQGSGGKGGKSHAFGGGAQKETLYRADLILALCEGPVIGVGYTWKDQTLYNYVQLNMSLFNGGSGPAGEQPIWGWTEIFYSPQALAYAGTAYMAAPWYQMGSTPTIGNLSFEVIGNLSGTGANGHDADPALVIWDFLTNARYGAGFDPDSIDQTTLFGPGGDASLQTYCKSLGIAFSPLISSQEAASSILARWLQIVNCAAVWSGGKLKFIPYGDTQTAVGDQQTFSRNFSIPYVVPQGGGGPQNWQLPAMITVSTPEDFVHDGGVVYSENGFPLLFIGVVTITAFNYTLPSNTYGFDPIGTYVFSIFDAGKPVTMTYTIKAGTGFAPLLTPVYDLGDADFVSEADTDPVNVDRVDVYSLPGIQRIEVTSRSNSYSPTPVEARDQAQIEMYGSRVGQTVTAHEICDEFTIGPVVAQLVLQRALYVRAHYTFKLSWEYCLLDPMDVVRITDLNLGLDQAQVRITSIEEDDNGFLTVVAEELVSGIGSAASNPSAGAGGPSHSFGQTAIGINEPLIYQPPTSLTSGVSQIWVGASPQPGGLSTQWGGANVFVSLDNATYAQVAQITKPLIQGLLSAYLPIAIAGTDPTDTASVDLSMSKGVLSNVDPTSASLGSTRSLIDLELISFTTATLTAANQYNLTGLYRGLSSSAPAAHATGASFARLDEAVVTYDLPVGVTGQTVYFKFQSFNAFGGGEQQLSDCAVFSIVIGSPSSVSHPISAQLLSGTPLDLGQVVASPSITDDYGTVTTAQPVDAIIDLGNFGVVSHPIADKLATGTPLDLGPVTGVVDVSDDFGAIVDSSIHVSDLGTIP